MKQPIRTVHKIINKTAAPKPNKINEGKKRRHKQEYGTSKLEDKFAREFLDKLGVNYERQFKAESIQRYYDFYIPSARLLIEIDGDYYHSYNKTYEQMSPMQKRNKRVDSLKDRWAAINCIPLIRIWEHDINSNPSKVMQLLRENIGICTKKQIINENKKKRH